MSSFKIAVFGCWNIGCNEGSGQRTVAKLISDKHEQENYKFMTILGDNYYSKKVDLTDKLNIKDTNIQKLKEGFNCLTTINIEKKLIMGNHDVKDSYDKNCSVLRTQFELPWYDVKFPYGYDLYYLYNGSDKQKVYETILFIYLDTSIYDTKKITDDNSCYEKILSKNIDELITNQGLFIENTLDKILRDLNLKVKRVIFFGHEPLITYKYKQKKDLEKTNILDNLLNILFEKKLEYKDVNFHWICADYHIYQNGNITSTNEKYKNLNISQLIFGTGGAELDEPSKNNNYELKEYKLNILKNEAYEPNGNKIELNTNGINKFGYGEIEFTLDNMYHKFIMPDYNYSQNNDIIYGSSVGGYNSDFYKAKYLKYKNKYIQLKKNN